MKAMPAPEGVARRMLGCVVLVVVLAGCAAHRPSAAPGPSPSYVCQGTCNDVVREVCLSYGVGARWHKPDVTVPDALRAARGHGLAANLTEPRPGLPFSSWQAPGGASNLTAVFWRVPSAGDDPSYFSLYAEDASEVQLDGRWGDVRAAGPDYLRLVSSAPAADRARWWNESVQSLGQVPDDVQVGPVLHVEDLRLDGAWSDALAADGPPTAQDKGASDLHGADAVEMSAGPWIFRFELEKAEVALAGPPGRLTVEADGAGTLFLANESSFGPSPEQALANATAALAAIGLDAHLTPAEVEVSCRRSEFRPGFD